MNDTSSSPGVLERLNATPVNARLKTVIDNALDASAEFSETLRASIAQQFWKLFAVDEEWAAAVASRLFCDVGSSTSTPEGWRVYLEWHRGHPSLYPLLATHYADGAKRVGAYMSTARALSVSTSPI